MQLVLTLERAPIAGGGSCRPRVRARAVRTCHPAISPDPGVAPWHEVRIRLFPSNISDVGPARPAVPRRASGPSHVATRPRLPGCGGTTARTNRVSPSSAVSVASTDRGFGEPSYTQRSERPLLAPPPHMATAAGYARPVLPVIASAAQAEGIQFEARNSHQCRPPGNSGGHFGGRPSCRDPVRRA